MADAAVLMSAITSSNDSGSDEVKLTGITDGELLEGVRYTGHGGETQSLVIRGKTGTVRWISGKHNFDKLNPLSEIEY